MIYRNETGGKREYLVAWNRGENFTSLGIGHFIWYPKEYEGPFDESFPKLVEYYRKKGVKLPETFDWNKDCPWGSRKEFLREKSSVDVQELIKFLEETKDIQTMFIYDRLEASLGSMLEYTNKKEHVRAQFYRVANSKNGLYPLVDYVNFKGEGIKKTERYNNEGWGLLQILENMNGSELGEVALEEFANEARYVLARRVVNAPKERLELRWLRGWFRRIDTYTGLD